MRIRKILWVIPIFLIAALLYLAINLSNNGRILQAERPEDDMESAEKGRDKMKNYDESKVNIILLAGGCFVGARSLYAEIKWC